MFKEATGGRLICQRRRLTCRVEHAAARTMTSLTFNIFSGQQKWKMLLGKIYADPSASQRKREKKLKYMVWPVLGAPCKWLKMYSRQLWEHLRPAAPPSNEGEHGRGFFTAFFAVIEREIRPKIASEVTPECQHGFSFRSGTFSCLCYVLATLLHRCKRMASPAAPQH